MRLSLSLIALAPFALPPTPSAGQAPTAAPVALANENRTPAGRVVRDTLVVQLTVGPATWPIIGDSAAPLRVLAFAEEGKAPSIPGPLIRVRVGTAIRVVIRNALDDTLTVRGLGERGGALDSIVILPVSSGTVSFAARRAGTFHYWGASAEAQQHVNPRVRGLGLFRPRFDSQLAGAFVVDSARAAADDRIFVITEVATYPPNASGRPTFERHGLPAREFTALNGRSWPNTERLRYASGDSIRWRIVNATFQTHPLHLHGFYFRVDSHGSARAAVDSVYAPAQRRMAVTEALAPGETMSMVWSPDRPGGWIFHCHLTQHIALLPPTHDETAFDYGSTHEHSDPDQHGTSGMNGMVLGVTISGSATASATWRPARRLRLFVQSDSTPNDTLRRFGYVLQNGDAEPRVDSLQHPGPVLVLTRGEPTSIEVVNRTTRPTAVHWHGIELESYYDGAVGWGGKPGRLTPAIRPGASFEVRMTPKRAGTFMYHTHFDDLEQQFGGLVGAIIVLEPGERRDPTRDIMLLASDARTGGLAVNGATTPVTMDLRVGTTYRLRVGDIAVYRQNLWIRVTRDSSLVSWRPVAKDGFTLPASQAVDRPSAARVSSGETADFELTPDRVGELMLEFGVPDPGSTSTPPRLQVQGTVRLRVAEASSKTQER